jgi:lipoprotein signal peptidase
MSGSEYKVVAGATAPSEIRTSTKASIDFRPIAPVARSLWLQTVLIVVAIGSADGATKVVASSLATQGNGSSETLAIKNPDFLLGITTGPVPVMLLASSLGIVLFGGYVLYRASRSRTFQWVPGLLIGGGLANLLDRLLFGFVHDWLSLPMVVVNLADVAVAVGLVGHLISVVVGREPRPDNVFGRTAGR